jgi:hypothetical protein
MRERDIRPIVQALREAIARVVEAATGDEPLPDLSAAQRACRLAERRIESLKRRLGDA